MTVTFNGRMIPGVLRGVDKYTEQALEIADVLIAEYGNEVYGAEVHRFDGLIIYRTGEVLFDLDESSDAYGWHFVTPICGYDGTGPMTTALILEKFGFGNAEDLISQINHGGNDAHFTFVKECARQ